MSWSAVAPLDHAVPLRAVEQVQVLTADRGFTVTARVFVDPDHPVLRGHFPGLPLYPGVFIVETLGQAMTEALRPYGGRPRLRAVGSLRLTAALAGSDELTLTAEVARQDGGWAVRAVGNRRDGVTAATIRATFDDPAALSGGLTWAPAALPQRHPLLLVDRVLTVDPGRTIETLKAVTASDPCYAQVPAGAALDAYAYPVSLLMESFGQSAALLWLGDEVGRANGSILLFVGARDYQVEGQAYPGDVVRHVVRLERVVAETAFATGESWVGDTRIARVGSLMAARRPREALTSPSTQEDRHVGS